MRILVTGVAGQLGYDVVKQLQNSTNHTVVGTDVNDLDLTSKNDVSDFLSKGKFDLIIHCAAYTAVDNAEDYKELCYDVNVNATKYLVDYCQENNCEIIYFSTDYVFNGDLAKSKEYDVNHEINPVNYYGKTKFLGEKEVRRCKKHKIFRISWVFGSNGHNFIKTMVRLSKTHKKLNVVSDQVGSPTYTYDVSKFIVKTLNEEEYGTYHLTNESFVSWDEYAKYIFHLIDSDVKVSSVTSYEYKTKAKRPFNSKLSKDSLNRFSINALPSWKDAVKRYLKEIGEL